uniref:DUF2304 domain-containing protein n=1 Tax=Solibacter usitatus (strain Ellin6076) TaxID=234267 RepID=Q01XM0_SOLUE
MIPVQPILIAALVAVVLLYFSRLRTKIADGLIILVCFGCASLLVIRPNIANRIANLVGVGRGADLILYLALPGMLMMILLLFAKTRQLNAKLTAAVREYAIRDASGPQTRSGSRE